MTKKKYVIWITGLSGSGKTSIAKLIIKDVEKLIGPTLLLHGDQIRSLFKLKSYKKEERFKVAMIYSKLCKLITNQNINVIFTVVGLFHKLHRYNRLNHKNYIEIFIKYNIKKIIKNKKKFFYINKSKNVWGVDIKPEFPKSSDIVIKNNFNKPLKELSKELIKKLSFKNLIN